MPGITEKERFKRRSKIRELLDEGMTQIEISKELGLPIATVQRNCQYLKDLAVSDITPEEKAEKRTEEYLVLSGVIEEMRKQYDKLIDEKPAMARTFMITLLSAVDSRKELYGLKIKPTDGIQVNQQFNIPTRKINSEIGDRITSEIKKQHEIKVANEV